VNRLRERARLAFALIAITTGASLCGSPDALAGPSLDQFEIKDLESVPGAIEFESQNDFTPSNPRRRIAPDGTGGIIADDNTATRQREGLEVEIGLTTFLKLRLGIELEQSRIDDPKTFNDAQRMGPLEFDGYGAETIWTVIPRKGDGIGAGFLVEYDQAVDSDEASTLTIGPIIEWQSGRWSATVNPTAIQYFGGGHADHGKLDFGYAARLMYRTSEEFALAIESYGGIERVAGGNTDDSERLFGTFDQYRLGPILYWTLSNGEKDDKAEDKDEKSDRDVETTIGFGALFGLNSDTPLTTIKLSLDVDY
jgi:hypothetical protein